MHCFRLVSPISITQLDIPSPPSPPIAAAGLLGPDLVIVRPPPPPPRPSTPQITTPAAMALIFPPHSYWPRNTWWLRSSSPFATEFPHRVSSLDLESRSRERVVAVGCLLFSPRPSYFYPNERFVG